MGNSPGQDETTVVNDDVLLVMQARGFAWSAGAPAGVRIHRTHGQTALGILEVPDLLMTNTVFLCGCAGKTRGPLAPMTCSLNSSAVMLLRERPSLLTLVFARLECAYGFGDNRPKRNNCAFRP